VAVVGEVEKVWIFGDSKKAAIHEKAEIMVGRYGGEGGREALGEQDCSPSASLM
jgi:hypothetical protein